MQWAARIGRQGLSVAVRGEGQLRDDRFSLALDPRTMALLGTVGRTVWYDGALAADGSVSLVPGPTAPADVKDLRGRWRATARGIELEVYLPFAAMGETEWPEEGDIGFALIWRHGDVALNWSGDSTWLSPREYGVLHRLTAGREKLPWVVRVR